MKKAYIKPTMESEAFVPNDYVAACENPTSYVGYCDISGNVYSDTNGNGQYDRDTDRYLYKNSACGRMYESQTQPHYNAFVVEEIWHPGHYEGTWPWGQWIDGYTEYRATPVFNYDNVHVTANIDTNLHVNVSV